MLEITRKQAIKDCKEIWSLVANGMAKDKFEAYTLVSESYRKRYGSASMCPFCRYTSQFKGKNCASCPYVRKYKVNCMTSGFSYKWDPEEFARRIMDI